MADSDDTLSQQRGLKPWRAGESGNPSGRPKGARNKLTEDFLSDVLDQWQVSGKQAIVDMIAEKPGDFVKMVAGLVPKEATLNVNNTDDLSDAELAERIRDITATLAPFIAGGIGEAEQGAAGAEVEAVASKLH
jgi:hypothetical protein